ncbi:poly A polymerase regulatory subunit [Pelomyxa schiedti]|nr:poly A polymerase regulatory subunit [Pelomyxa schiedti]
MGTHPVYIVRPDAVMTYSAHELSLRKGCLGSTLCKMDVEKSLHLSTEMMSLWDENPHMRQVWANKRNFMRPFRCLEPCDRIISEKTPALTYARRCGEAKTLMHLGQRKLILSEIEFLAKYCNPGDFVVYAGAAPGTHINFMSGELFPTLQFHLFDPADFHAHETDRIKIFQEFFTDKHAQQYAVLQNFIFICDIRGIEGMPNAATEAQIQQEMNMQMGWIETMRPRVSMLKFRLPYSPGKTLYLDGVLHFQMWAGRTSSESRLIITRPEGDTPFPKLEYNHGWYSDVMYHFNTVTRTTFFESEVLPLPGMDHCYDCCSELHVLQTYLQSVHAIPYIQATTCFVVKPPSATEEAKDSDIQASVPCTGIISTPSSTAFSTVRQVIPAWPRIIKPPLPAALIEAIRSLSTTISKFLGSPI